MEACAISMFIHSCLTIQQTHLHHHCGQSKSGASPWSHLPQRPNAAVGNDHFTLLRVFPVSFFSCPLSLSAANQAHQSDGQGAMSETSEKITLGLLIFLVSSFTI